MPWRWPISQDKATYFILIGGSRGKLVRFAEHLVQLSWDKMRSDEMQSDEMSDMNAPLRGIRSPICLYSPPCYSRHCTVPPCFVKVIGEFPRFSKLKFDSSGHRFCAIYTNKVPASCNVQGTDVTYGGWLSHSMLCFLTVIYKASICWRS